MKPNNFYDYLEKYYGIKLYPFLKIYLNLFLRKQKKIPVIPRQFSFWKTINYYKYLLNKEQLNYIPLWPNWMWSKGK